MMKRLIIIIIVVTMIITLVNRGAFEEFGPLLELTNPVDKKCRYTRVPSSWECLKHEHQNCNFEMKPGDDNKYKQCTNNNLDTPNNLPCTDCSNRGMDLCPHKYRISERCDAGHSDSQFVHDDNYSEQIQALNCKQW